MLTSTLLLCFLAPAFDTPAPTIDTIAGTGKPGHAGDGGKGVDALLHDPAHCDLDGIGHLYIAEAAGHCVRKLDLKTGLISTVAGTGKKGYSGDGGLATDATLNEPYAAVVSPDGDLYIADRLNAVVRRVDGKTGFISTVAGTGKKGFAGDGGPAVKALMVEPHDCCLDGRGGLLIADVGDGRIRRLDLKTGLISTFAGTGNPKSKLTRSDLGDGGPATKAVILGARAVCVGDHGDVYICEREGNAVRRVDPAGVITTIAGSGARGLTDGPATRATFDGPKAIRADRAGNLYIVDTENHAIRRIDAKTREVTTVAGGRKGPQGDGGDPLKAALDRPHGCAIDLDGTLYIADSGNNRVRRVRIPR
jgi:streptogramin lyase